MVHVRPDVVTGIANTIGAAVDGPDGGLSGIVGLLNSGDDFQASHAGADFSGRYGQAFADGFDNVAAMFRQWSDASQAYAQLLRDSMRAVAGVDQQTADSLERIVTGG